MRPLVGGRAPSALREDMRIRTNPRGRCPMRLLVGGRAACALSGGPPAR
jgi:hypothetical protein